MPKRRDPLPRRCECGGKMVYSRAFGRTFSYCDRCTPVVNVSRQATLSAPEKGTARE